MPLLIPTSRSRDQKLTRSHRVWLALIVTVVNRIRIPVSDNGLYQILQRYAAPNETFPATPTWAQGFSNGVVPVQCHSHNDYWHRVPLYEGLAAGCVSTEADIWVGNTTDGHVDLFVGHDQRSLSPSRTLQSLYLGPLSDILTQQNSAFSDHRTLLTDSPGFVSTSPIGVFTMAPNVSLVLLLDFKTTGNVTWDTVMSQLNALRARGWLTFWTPAQGIVERPLTIVASGAAPFDAITSNVTYRDVFYDSLLTQLSDVNTPFHANNSYYASASLQAAVGTVTFPNMKGWQKSRVASQVQRASELGLKSRYWDTPSWPVGWRNQIWSFLVEEGASVLNVDDLTAGARWDWRMCIVGGLNICNS
jgi:hypothetical protein